MGHKRMCRMISRNEDAGAYRLFPEVIVEDLPLNALHDVPAKITHDSEVYPGVHQSKGVARSDHAIERWQVFETPMDNLDFGMGAELPTQHITKLFSSIDENQSHVVWKLSYWKPTPPAPAA